MKLLKKPSKNLAAFQREVERLERIVKKANKQGIVFLKSPIPETPERVTKKRLSLIQNITKLDVYSQGYEPDKVTGELKKVEDSRKNKKVKKYGYGIQGGVGGFGGLRDKKEKPVKEKVKRIKKERVKLTPEQLKEIRQKAGKKAAESLKKHMAEDPEFAKQIIERRKRAFEKGREIRRKWEKEHPKEAFERRSKAAKKAAETRKIREAEDEEYREHMREVRLGNLKKARETKKRKKLIEDTKEWLKTRIKPEHEEFLDEEELDEMYDDTTYESSPHMDETILYNVYSILSSPETPMNATACEWAVSRVNEYVSSLGINTVIFNLNSARDEAIDRATIIAHDSDSVNVWWSVECLLNIISANNLSMEDKKELDYIVNGLVQIHKRVRRHM